MCAGLSKLPATRGGSFILLLKQKNLKALVWWANDRAAQDLAVDPVKWTDETMCTAKKYDGRKQSF